MGMKPGNAEIGIHDAYRAPMPVCVSAFVRRFIHLFLKEYLVYSYA
jgi:hypothetical protein